MLFRHTPHWANQVNLPLKAKFGLLYTSPVGWLVGRSVWIWLYSYLSPTRLGLGLSLAIHIINRNTDYTQITRIIHANYTEYTNNYRTDTDILQNLYRYLYWFHDLCDVVVVVPLWVIIFKHVGLSITIRIHSISISILLVVFIDTSPCIGFGNIGVNCQYLAMYRLKSLDM